MSENIKGVSDIKTVQKAKIRSKPKSSGQEFLELYLMHKEKERLERYKETIDKAKEQTEGSLDEVNKEMDKVKDKFIDEVQQDRADKGANGDNVEKEPKKKPKSNHLKSMEWDY